MDRIDTLTDQLQSNDDPVYNPNNIYWCFIDDKNRIGGMFGFLLPVHGLSEEMGKPVNIGKLNEIAYTAIHNCMHSKGSVCYLDVENEEIHYYRLVVDLDQDPEAISGDLLIGIYCLDEDDNKQELDSIEVVNSKLPTKDRKPRKCKIDLIENTANITFSDKGEYSLKIIGYYKGTKLKCYIQCKHL